MSQHDRYAGANQYKRIDGTDPFFNMHVDRLGPRTSRHAKPHNDVRPDQRRKKHNLGRQEQPQHGLAARHGQRRLIDQLDMTMSVSSVVVTFAGLCELESVMVVEVIEVQPKL